MEQIRWRTPLQRKRGNCNVQKHGRTRTIKASSKLMKMNMTKTTGTDGVVIEKFSANFAIDEGTKKNINYIYCSGSAQKDLNKSIPIILPVRN